MNFTLKSALNGCLSPSLKLKITRNQFFMIDLKLGVKIEDKECSISVFNTLYVGCINTVVSQPTVKLMRVRNHITPRKVTKTCVKSIVL